MDSGLFTQVYENINSLVGNKRSTTLKSSFKTCLDTFFADPVSDFFCIVK